MDTFYVTLRLDKHCSPPILPHPFNPLIVLLLHCLQIPYGTPPTYLYKTYLQITQYFSNKALQFFGGVAMQELYLYLEAPEQPEPEQQEPTNTEQRGCEEIDFTIPEDNITEVICD